jgi:hypothetical protein
MANAAVNEAAELVVVPAAVLPQQMFAAGLHAGLQPERRLMLAVLEEAVADVQRLCFATAPLARREFRAAQEWIEREDHEWPFSFVRICDALGLEAQAIRRGLRAWLAHQRALPVGARTRIRHPFRRTSGIRTHARGRAAGIRISE